MKSALKVGIYGLGLIGGSLAKAFSAIESGLAVFGYDIDERRMKMAISEGTVEGVLTDDVLGEMDVVVLAIPVARSVEVAKRIISGMRRDAVLTDCGSVKEGIYEAMKGYQQGPHFVPGHPIAGTEKSGYENGDPDLYRGKIVFLTPYKDTPVEKVNLVKSLWNMVGAGVLEMDPKEHDHIFAFVSHLPHVVAYSLVYAIATFDSNLPLGYSAGGFKDFTRIASSDTVMWTEIMLENQREVLNAISHFKKSLTKLEEMIIEKDHGGMKEYFGLSKKKRDSI
jgi:prephenate dehydrogenase